MTTTRLIPAPGTGMRSCDEVGGAPPPDRALDPIFGPPPILDSEDADAYEALHDRVRAAMAPADVIEELWVRDVVDLTWEALRLRRLKAKLMAVARPRALSAILRDLVVDARRRQLVDGWIAGKRSARTGIERTLADAGLDETAVEAVMLSQNLDDIERIDRMIMQAEVRRHGVLRESDRHRDASTRRLRGIATGREAADLAATAPPAGAALA
jgi:hypothetical protein